MELQRRLAGAHGLLGLVTIVVFLATGQVMDFQQVGALPEDSGLRLLFHSRHLYVLFGGLLNVAIALRFVLPPGGGARVAALVGSGLTLLAPVLFTVAFVLEPLVSGEPGVASALGAYAALGGVLLYALSSWRQT